eukprot:1195755-Prorocentrum_minimum.AAC.3
MMLPPPLLPLVIVVPCGQLRSLAHQVRAALGVRRVRELVEDGEALHLVGRAQRLQVPHKGGRVAADVHHPLEGAGELQ